MKFTITGELIKQSRKKAGLTQADVASLLKYDTAQFISNWERGLSHPPIRSAKRLCKNLGLDRNVFFKAMLDDNTANFKKFFNKCWR